MKFSKIYLSLLVLLSFACTDHETPPKQEPTIYAVGYESNGKTVIAQYWKNNVPYNLTDGSKESIAYDIAVSGNNIYAVGLEDQNTSGTVRPSRAMLWKNGDPIPLTTYSGVSRALSVAVLNEDTHIVGIEYDGNVMIPRYWKNGVSVPLPTLGAEGSANDIVIVNGDTYIAGELFDLKTFLTKAVYWKNGELINISGNEIRSTYGKAIALINNNVHVVGHGYGNNGIEVAKHWNNGSVTNLSDGSYNAIAEDITFIGNNIYITGNSSNGVNHAATYWKNGTPVNLSQPGKKGYATSIKAFEGKIYVGGIELDNVGESYTSKVWHDGVANILKQGSNYNRIYSIAVVK